MSTIKVTNIQNPSSGTDDIQIDANGNVAVDTNTLYVDATNNRVGIGTTSPDAALHISNSVAEIRLTDSDGNGDYANIISGATGNLFLSADAGNGGANSFMSFQVDNTERMRIANNGAINTFVSNVTGFTVRNDAPGGTTIANIECARDATNTSDGTVTFRVWTNGNVVNQNNSYGPISSDERLKQDINDANSQWDDIKNIRITNFHYKNDPAGPLHLGPIAQELEQVSPGLITRRPASEDEIADPSNGLVDGDEVLSFKASVLYMKAVKALQEAMERIETLEAEVAALKTP